MTINTYYVMYGVSVSQTELWNYFYKGQKNEETDEDDLIDFISDACLYKTTNEVTKNINKLNTEFKQNVMSENPNFDQVFFNEKFSCVSFHHDITDMDDKVFIGILLMTIDVTKNNKTTVSDNFLNHTSEYEKFVKVWEGTSLEKIFSDTVPCIMTLQDDCGCCS